MKIKKDFIYDPSLVLYLPLYQLDGSSFMDKSAYGHLCQNTGATWGIQGRTFDGIDDRINKDNLVDVSTLSGITIMGWINWTDGSATGAVIIGTRNSGYVMVRPETNNLQAIVATPDEAEYCLNYPSNSLRGTGWNHFAASYHAGSPTATITGIAFLINGVDQGVFTTSGTPTFAELTGAAADNFNLGVSFSSTVNDNIGAYNAIRLGEVLVYTRALTVLEMRRHYEMTKRRYR